MKQKGDSPKQSVCFRISSTNRTGLEQLVKESGSTLSSLADMAIEEFLADRIGLAVSNQVPFSLNSADIDRVAPVVKAIGKSVSLKLFVSIVEEQRTAFKA